MLIGPREENMKKWIVMLSLLGLAVLLPFCLKAEELGAAAGEEPNRILSITGRVLTPEGGMLISPVVRIIETGEYSTTANQCYYFFFDLAPGIYNLEATYTGFGVTTSRVVLLPGVTINLDIMLTPLEETTLSGRVVTQGSFHFGVPNAQVRLSGYDNHQVTADSQGYFFIPGIYNTVSYELAVEAPGYYPIYETIHIEDAPCDLGEITLYDQPIVPSGVAANLNQDFSSVNLSWNLVIPQTIEGQDRSLQGFRIFRLTDGQQDNHQSWIQLGYTGQSPMTYTDSSWDDLPNGDYLYAIRAVYSGTVVSEPGYSAILQKNQMGVISGRITRLGSSVPINNALISSGSYSAHSNSQGYYMLTLPQGVYDIQVSAPPYLPYSHEDIYVLAGTSVTHNVAMMEFPYPPPNPSIEREGYNIVISWGDRRPGAVLERAEPDRDMLGCLVYRLLAGDENNEAAWTQLSSYPLHSPVNDPSWCNQEPGNYRWAIKACYPGNNLSSPAFSPILVYPTETGTVFGRVMTTTGYPVQNALVGVGPISTITDIQGDYSLTLLAGSSYLIYAHHDSWGYGHGSDHFTLLPNQILQVDCTLYPYDNVVESFEQYSSFSPPGDPWMVADLDQELTYGSSTVSWPGAGQEQSWMVFDPRETIPPIQGLNARDGYKFLAAFSAIGAVSSDMLISPAYQRLTELKFWARSYDDNHGLERFRIKMGQADQAPEDYYYLDNTYTEVPTTWTAYNFWLPDIIDSMRVAIECVSDDTFMLMIDEISLEASEVDNVDPAQSCPAFQIGSIYPNPFNPSTTIEYQVSAPAEVKLEIYNLKGQLICTLVDQPRDAGSYIATWQGLDHEHRPVASGIYFCRLQAGGREEIRKLCLMK